MMQALRRWWWVPLVVLLGLTLKAFMVASWVSGTVETAAVDTLGAEGLDGVNFVEVSGVDDLGADGLNVVVEGPAGDESATVAALEARDEINEVVYRPLAGGAIAGATDSDTDDAAADSDDAAAEDDAATTTAAPTTTEAPAETTTTTAAPTTTEAAAEPAGPDLEAQLNELFALEPIEFDTSRSTIRPESQSTLDQAAEAINANPDFGRLLVVGHTDSDGSEAANLSLSAARAEAVLDYLVETGGVDPDRLEAEGRGETELLVTPEVTPEDKQRNRRIEWEPLS